MKSVLWVVCLGIKFDIGIVVILFVLNFFWVFVFCGYVLGVDFGVGECYLV